jgi:hypothetical protein
VCLNQDSGVVPFGCNHVFADIERMIVEIKEDLEDGILFYAGGSESV